MKKIVIIIVALLVGYGLTALGHNIYLAHQRDAELKQIDQKKEELKSGLHELDKRREQLCKQRDDNILRENKLWKIRRAKSFAVQEDVPSEKYLVNDLKDIKEFELPIDDEDYYLRVERITSFFWREHNKLLFEYFAYISEAKKVKEREEELRGYKVNWDFLAKYEDEQ